MEESMDYGVVKKDEVKYSFVNGCAETEVLSGALDFIKSYKGIIKEGSNLEGKSRDRVISTYIFTSGKGYVLTKKKAYNIEELSFFFTSMTEDYVIHAVTDLEYTKFDLFLSDYDVENYKASHLVLPLFRKESDCLIYTQDVKKNDDNVQYTVVQGRQMVRLVVGSNHAEEDSGFYEIGHNAVAQYNVCHSKCDFTMEVNGIQFEQKAGDMCYIKAGLPHGSIIPKGHHLDYVYYEVFVKPEGFMKSFPEGPFEDISKKK